jgi:hypothetical protein
VAAWTGPTGTNQDFQLPRLALEIKASSHRTSAEIPIANERQLDDTGVENLILVMVVLDERRGGTGTSLNTIVEDTRQAIPDIATREQLDDLLIQVGYFPAHREQYDEPRYTVREIRYWSVRSDFPRITETDLRPGVSTCSYRIHTTGLDEYRMPADGVRDLIGGTDG